MKTKQNGKTNTGAGRTSEDWRKGFAKLQAFHRKHHHSKISADNGELHGWAVQQRKNVDKLSLEQIEKLYRLSFEFNRIDQKWFDRFFQLLEFENQHGNTRVPARWRKNPKLASWVNIQRRIQDQLLPWRKKLLNQAGFIWDPHQEIWEERFAELQNFKKKFGHVNVPARWKENPELGVWVMGQRRRKEYLTSDQKNRLLKLGFEWEPQKNFFEQRIKELVEFKKRHGHLHVPERWKDNPALGWWVHDQRKRKDILSSDRLRSLNRIGFPWSAQEKQTPKRRLKAVR